MSAQAQYRDEAAVARRLLGLLMSAAPPPAPERALPAELHRAARATYFLLNTDERADVEGFVTNTLGRLMRQLNYDTRQHPVVLRGRVRGRVVWPATFKAHYSEDYDPSRYVCREVRRQYNTPENQMLKHLIERLDECLKLVPEVLRVGTCCYPSAAGAPRFSERTALRLEKLEVAVNGFRRSSYLQQVSSPGAVDESHLVQAETSRIEEYAEAARFYRLYASAMNPASLERTVGIGRRALPLPGRLHAGGEAWVLFSAAVLRANGPRPE